MGIFPGKPQRGGKRINRENTLENKARQTKKDLLRCLPMKKQTEIEILRKAAAELGANSYCGEWLVEQIPFIESEIAADLMPGTFSTLSIAEAKKTAAEIVRAAEFRAKEIREAAEREAKETKDAARREIQETQARFARILRETLAKMGFSQ